MAQSLYVAYFTGVAGQSIGLFYIGNGIFTGIDVGAMRYDGSYTTESDGTLNGVIEYILPANTPSITGASGGALPTSVALKLSLPPKFDDGRVISIETPLGPVNARFEKLRNIP